MFIQRRSGYPYFHIRKLKYEEAEENPQESNVSVEL